MKISPTIGRVILVWPEARCRTDRPWPGLIADVHYTNILGDLNLIEPLITVGAVNPTGNHVAFERIPILDPFPEFLDGAGDQVRSEFPAHAFACWMPFQLVQASKVDELTPLLAAIGRLLVRAISGLSHDTGDVVFIANKVGVALPPWVTHNGDSTDDGSSSGLDSDAAVSTPAPDGAESIGCNAPPPGAASLDDGAAAALPVEANSQGPAADEHPDSIGTGPARASEVGV